MVNGLKTYSFGSNTPFTDDDTTKTYLDNISKDMPNVTAYRRAVNLNYVNQILGGGQFLIEGFKYNNDYEYQIAMRYSTLGSVTMLGRSKYKGVWPDKWTTLT